MISFSLPDELIAQKPAVPRDAARLLVYDRGSATIADSVFSKLNDFLPKESTLVINDSKVEHCRWLFHDGRTEVFVLQKLDTHTVRAMVRPGRRFKIGNTVNLAEGVDVFVSAVDDDGIRTLRLNLPHDDTRLLAYEHVPLPPYIKQDDELADEYQTVYAQPLGSKAAPTAGLHFTTELLERIAIEHDIERVTLHVGLGTFAPLTEAQLAAGALHEEWYEIPADSAERLKKATHRTAVGTTSVRTLETYFTTGKIAAWTDILIQPGYSFRAVDSLITNFHLPGTSLLLLVEALVGSQAELQRIYEHAIAERYRFYSFGDAMLII